MKSSLFVMLKDSMFNLSENITQWQDLPADFREEYISYHMGEIGTTQNTAVFMSVFYGGLLLLGIPGNVMTVLIIYFNKNMRTPTNFFLLNLAVTDFITLTTVLPLEVMLLWKPVPWALGVAGCHIMTVLSEVVAYVSVLTMLAFTYERYTAICYPLRPSLHSDGKRTRIIIVGIWIISLIPALAWTNFTKLHFLAFGDHKITETAVCTIGIHDVGFGIAGLSSMIFVLMFVVPVIIFPITYYKIVKAMHASVILQPVTRASQMHKNYRYIVIRMQIAVVACFLICWFPYHVQRLSFVYLSLTNSWTVNLHSLYKNAHVITGCFYYVNCVCNPFLYSLFSHRFRQGFHKLLKRVTACTSTETSITDLAKTTSPIRRHVVSTTKEEKSCNNASMVTFHNGDQTVSIITRSMKALAKKSSDL